MSGASPPKTVSCNCVRHTVPVIENLAALGSGVGGGVGAAGHFFTAQSWPMHSAAEQEQYFLRSELEHLLSFGQ